MFFITNGVFAQLDTQHSIPWHFWRPFCSLHFMDTSSVSLLFNCT